MQRSGLWQQVRSMDPNGDSRPELLIHNSQNHRERPLPAPPSGFAEYRLSLGGSDGCGTPWVSAVRLSW